MAMRKLIITIDDDAEMISDWNALMIIASVVNLGRISHGDRYCLGTTFTEGYRVQADKTKTGTDTFRIWRNGNGKP